MGGGFTLLPTLLPWAQLGAGNPTRPNRPNCFDCLLKSANIETSLNRFYIGFEAILGPIWCPLGLHSWPPTASNIPSMLIASVNATANARQPRGTVNIGTRSTCAVCVFHRKCTKNRLLDVSVLPFLATSLASRFRMASKTRLGHDFLRI